MHYDPYIAAPLFGGRKRVSELPEAYLRLRLTSELPEWVRAAIVAELQRREAQQREQQQALSAARRRPA
jgi:hypothetical protein